MRISDWSSDVCSSDLVDIPVTISLLIAGEFRSHESTSCPSKDSSRIARHHDWEASNPSRNHLSTSLSQRRSEVPTIRLPRPSQNLIREDHKPALIHRSEEHTSELQSLMRISYAVLCFNKKKT